ncbi:thymidine phosphorylase/ribose 1,5-bisphosphokinase [Paracoccus halophilus]|uniref:Thymidine phosphorylase/ribose 1,5-bisphosphokinase n=1 Tax=Paracoccus halophilus TaxID=376733 RepID=A0A1I0SI06_9RHOB|nr:hypothetical protein [Paracoccus halophilus]SFA39151.1 thymidine phosphorylase/ribose 1,5-bisphosphokinase [Paracoccus halophilus]
MLARGEFFHHWQAHGLRHGLPRDLRDDLGRGINVIVNGSRREPGQIAGLWQDTCVLPPEH